MAADFVKVDKSKTAGSQSVGLAVAIKDVQQRISSLLAAGNHMWDTGNHVLLEEQFGLVAGTGANFLAMLGNLNTIFNTNGTVAGQTRLDQIAEFTARLSPQ